MRKIILLTLVSANLVACASMSGWQPTIDSENSPVGFRESIDRQQCEMLTKQAAGNPLGETAKGAAIGGLAGGAAGAAIGAPFGSPEIGAAIGGAAGGIGGALYKGITADDDYKSAFKSCMRQRGHKVIW